MATKIIHKKSSVAGSAPSSSDLEPGELALNLTDKKIYTKQTDGTIISLGASALTALSDVIGGTPTDGYILVWDNSNSRWKYEAVDNILPDTQEVTSDLGNWGLGGATASSTGFSIEGTSTTLFFKWGSTKVFGLSSAGALQIKGFLNSNQAVGGNTITQSAGVWSYQEDNSKLYFQYGSTNMMSVTEDGDLNIAGDFNSNATVAGNTATSFYINISGGQKLELTATGDLSIVSDFDAEATIT